MKLFFVSLVILVSLVNAQSVDIEKISQKIDSIIMSDKISAKIDYQVYDPFRSSKRVVHRDSVGLSKKETKKTMAIQTILNSKAFIYDEWYGIGDKVQGYKIKSINQDSVTLVKNSKTSILKVQNSKNIIKMKELK